MKRNSTELKRRMEGNWLNAFLNLAPELNAAVEKLGENVPCPKAGGIDGFRLFDDANYTGGGVKQAERVFPEGIGLLMWLNGWEFTKTYDELEAWLGGNRVEARPVTRPATRPKVVDETGMRRWLNKIWREAVPLADLMAYPAKAYFNRRWLRASALVASDLRFHPCLNYKNKQQETLGKYGAILALVRNNNGEPVSIHRTFITKSGLKADLDEQNKARKVTPPVNKQSKGRCIHLFQPEDGVLGVAEGLETALSVYCAKRFPVWPLLANTNKHTFVPPNGVHTVIDFVDKDRNKAGENSADVLTQKLNALGIRVITLLPPTPILNSDSKGVDWADQLKRDVAGFDILDSVLDFNKLKHA